MDELSIPGILLTELNKDIMKVRSRLIMIRVPMIVSVQYETYQSKKPLDIDSAPILHYRSVSS